MHPMDKPQDSQENEVIVNITGKAGVISLNRPSALNALSLSMVRTITSALQRWKNDDSVEFVLIHSNNNKAFCAGGDIRAIYAARLRNDFDFCDSIFREEYELNYLISSYPKPYIALIDGICMGGGMGISIYGSHRIVSEKAALAMPETKIGFYPDIGSSYFFSKIPNEIGIFLGLVGQSLNAADAIYTNMATHYMQSSKLCLLKTQLLKAKSATQALSIIEQEKEEVGDSHLEIQKDLIKQCFSGLTVDVIFKQLENAANSNASNWLRILDQRSPTSLKVALAILRHNSDKSLAQCLATELCLSRRFCRNYDFFEGIRALLIDKDNNPNWLHRHLNQVSTEMVDSYFIPIDSNYKLRI